MLERAGITKRFISCFPDRSPVDLAAELAGLFKVTPATVFQWLSGVRDVPWNRLKIVRDMQGLSWDWLIEGIEPKYRNDNKTPKENQFVRHAINQRFLSLFPDLSQKALGELLGVKPVAVYRWQNDTRQVPWKKLKYAVKNKMVTWEWLLEGL